MLYMFLQAKKAILLYQTIFQTMPQRTPPIIRKDATYYTKGRHLLYERTPPIIRKDATYYMTD